MSQSVSLLISKVDDVEVLQLGESRLSVSNRKADGSKVSAVDQLATKLGRGQTRTIDLGAGAKKYTITIAVTDRADNDKLFDILYNKRHCSITDKFKGKLKVYIDAVDIVDSDAHINQTVYTVNCTAQSIDKAPSVNYLARILTTSRKIKDELTSDVSEFRKLIGTIESYIDDTGVVQFYDSGMEIVHTAIDKVNDAEVEILGFTSRIKSKVNETQRAFDSLKRIVNFPSEFVELVTDTIDAIIPKDDEKKTKNYKAKKVAMPIVRGKSLSDIDLRIISSIERDQLEKDQYASWIANKLTFLKDINAITTTKFLSDEHFNDVVSSAIAKVDEMGYSEDKASDIVFTIQKFAAEQEWGDIIEIDGDDRPMASIVHNYYGSIDNLARILEINAFKDNDNINTKVKVFK